MATIVSFNGSSYSIPANGDSNWGANVSSYLIALASGTLQRSGGTFTLTAELNFGTSFGLKSLYYKSTATNPSSAGVFKLGNNESIGWRNAGNTADFLLKVNASDALQYDSKTFLFSGEIVNADISASAAIALSKLAALTTSKALVSDGSGVISASTVTSTELGYLSGVTSSVQTQLDGKQASGSYALTTGKLSQFAATTSAELAGVISDETGTGSLVFSNSPSFTTPSLGVATATSINATTIPSTKTLVVTTDKLSVMAATSSSELAGIISDETGSGSLVFANSPSFTTPSLGAATATSINSTTIPSSKTLVVTTDKLSVLAATSSSELAGVISDETGSGSLVFATSPTLTTPTMDVLTIDGQASTPSTPSSGFYKTYIKDSTGKLTVLDSSGVERSAGGVSAWGASTPYSVGDLVTYGIFIYSCLTAHTSSSTMETDLAGTSPKWKIVNTEPSQQNLMTYGFDFESGDVAGWTAVGCATVTNGLLVSAGSGGAAFSAANGGRTKGANTTSPAVVSSGQLDGLYSLNFATSGAGTIGDMYISSTYKIPIAYQSTVLQVKFKYKVVSGSPVMAGTSSNTYAAAIYDLDNNSWSTMALVGNFNFVQSSGVGTFTGTFQVPYNSTQFQIAIYNPVAPTGASSLYVDDFYVGPQLGADTGTTAIATNVYRASSQSLTSASTTKIQFATIVFDDGNCYDATTNYRYTVKTPGRYLIATQLVFAGNATNIRITMIYKNGSEIFRSHSNTNILAQSTYLPATFTANLLAGDYIEVYGYQDSGGALNVGGSNTTFLSVQLLTSPAGLINSGIIAASMTNGSGAAQSISAATNTKVVFNTVLFDSNNAFDKTTNYRYTFPASGYYSIFGTIPTTAPSSATSLNVLLYKNGSQSKQTYIYMPTVQTTACSYNFQDSYNAGDYIEIYVLASQAFTIYTGAAAYGGAQLNVQKITGPSVIAATETVAARYTNTAGTAVPNVDTILDFPTKDYDSHSAVTTGASFKFSAPNSGLYEISVNLLTNNPTTVSGIIGRIRKNGTAVKSTLFTREVATATYIPLVIQARIRLLAGEYADFICSETVNANSLDTTTGANSFEVIRVGNYV
jgi:hypothetical protein